MGEGVVEARGDHVFDADEAGVGGRGVVNEALADVWKPSSKENLQRTDFFAVEKNGRRWAELRKSSVGLVGEGEITFIDMRAIMVRLHAAMGFVCVDMKGVEMGTD